MSQTQTQAVTTGDTSSQLLDHITSYPVVHDAISTFKSNPYGKKSLELSNTGYEKFFSPFVPYAKRPYGYVAPYVAKADSLASDGLTKVDKTFPIVKQDTETIKDTLLSLALYPFHFAGDKKDYVTKTYSTEYKKCGGDGYLASGKALITSSLIISSDAFAWLSESFYQKKEEGTQYAAKKYGQAANFADEKSSEAAKILHERSAEMHRYGHEQSEHIKNLAYQKKDEAKDVAGHAKETADKKGHEAKHAAKEKSGK